MKTVVVLQSNYIPWKGYFDLIRDADLFIFYDDLQFTKNDWRNRNKIKTQKGSEWLTIPVGSSASRLICEVEIKDFSWQVKHWKTIRQNYGKSSYFANYRDFFEDIYLGQKWANLSLLNQSLIRLISSDLLNLKTEFRDSRDYDLSGQKLNRLMELLVKAEADRYISGPAAKNYIDEPRFTEACIELVWKDYSGYPEYPQRFPPFEHGVSILDLLFNVGPDAPWYIWGWRYGGSGPA
ncbi:MAG: WbqC family protein [Chromatiales bacterium]|nr:WbqC family protein [Chromatiales bacterium]MCK7579218.1 WbqC family protein [Chromatiales bacterium]